MVVDGHCREFVGEGDLGSVPEERVTADQVGHSQDGDVEAMTIRKLGQRRLVAEMGRRIRVRGTGRGFLPEPPQGLDTLDPHRGEVDDDSGPGVGEPPEERRDPVRRRGGPNQRNPRAEDRQPSGKMHR